MKANKKYRVWVSYQEDGAPKGMRGSWSEVVEAPNKTTAILFTGVAWRNAASNWTAMDVRAVEVE